MVFSFSLKSLDFFCSHSYTCMIQASFATWDRYKRFKKRKPSPYSRGDAFIIKTIRRTTNEKRTKDDANCLIGVEATTNTTL